MTTLKRKTMVIFGAFLIVVAVVSTSTATVSSGQEVVGQETKQSSYTISAINWEQTADEFILTVSGNAPPTYTMYELFDPLRVVIDIADAKIGSMVSFPIDLSQGPISTVNGIVLEDKEPYIARVELFLKNDKSYTVERVGSEIIIKFSSLPSENQEFAETPPEEGDEQKFTAPAKEIDDEPLSEEELALEKYVKELSAPEETAPFQDQIIEPVIPSEFEPVVGQKSAAKILFDIEIERSAIDTKVYLKADGVINNYKQVKLKKNVKANRPDRIYIDVKNVRLSGTIATKKVGTALSQVRIGQRTDGFRIVFDSGLDQLFDYSITEKDDGLLVTIREPSAATAVIAELIEDEGPVVSTTPDLSMEPEMIEAVFLDDNSGATEEVQPEKETKPEVDSKKVTTEANLSNLTFAGYDKQRITVDFYKIDLHNVFRLFGEISNLNIVVDQGVGGSLTLALNDVPWDFALDIILNLKNLQKEERYNTLVISQKSKKFTWPERVLEKVEFKVDTKIDPEQQSEEGIRIRKMQEVPEIIVEAKKLIHQAQSNEKLGNYTAALPLYEDAFVKWPENIVIAKRIAAISLVHLGHNSKAIHYAKVALKANRNDMDSALQAAIGLARMEKNGEAEKYFDLATGSSQPSSEALTSYATFCEESQNFEKALSLLQQHEDFHGDSLQTMIGKARILDKQGNRAAASEEYKAIMLSGYEIPPDLARYIKGRASLAIQ